MKAAALYKLKHGFPLEKEKKWKVNVKQCAYIFVRLKPSKKVRK